MMFEIRRVKDLNNTVVKIASIWLLSYLSCHNTIFNLHFSAIKNLIVWLNSTGKLNYQYGSRMKLNVTAFHLLLKRSTAFIKNTLKFRQVVKAEYVPVVR